MEGQVALCIRLNTNGIAFAKCAAEQMLCQTGSMA
jgi:hypothetical protein